MRFSNFLLVAMALIASVGNAAPRFIDPPTLTANPNPAVPLAAILRFQADAPVTTIAEISDGRHQWVLRFPPSRNPKSGLPIVGMRPAREHRIQVVIEDADGARSVAPESLRFTTPPLPDGEGDFPPIRVTASKPGRMEPGFTLFSPRRSRVGDPRFGASFGLLVMVDAEGVPVWYYRTNSRISDLQRLRNGNFAFLTQDYRALEIDLLGNVVNTWYAKRRPAGPVSGIAIDTAAIHHELDELPNGNLLVLGAEFREIDFFTSETDPGAPRAPQKVMGDEILEITRDGSEVWRWRAFDALDPYRIGYETFDGYWTRRGFPEVKADFSHGNGLLYDEKDDAVLINFRMLSNVMKIDRKTKEIRWILGDAHGLSDELKAKTFRLEGPTGRWFYHQHAPTPTPWGTFMVFDNGNYLRWPFDPPVAPGETYSRAVEYRLDETKRIAYEVWSSEKDPAPEEWAYSIAMGDVDPMPKTGNVLVHYGMLVPRTEEVRASRQGAQQLVDKVWSRIREYARTQPSELLWELVLGDPKGGGTIGWALYGGERLESLMPE